MYTDPRAFQIEYLALEQEYLVVFVKNIPHEEVLKMDADEFKAIYVECVKQTGHATASSFRGWTPKSISADKPIGRMAAAKSGKAAKNVITSYSIHYTKLYENYIIIKIIYILYGF